MLLEGQSVPFHRSYNSRSCHRTIPITSPHIIHNPVIAPASFHSIDHVGTDEGGGAETKDAKENRNIDMNMNIRICRSLDQQTDGGGSGGSPGPCVDEAGANGNNGAAGGAAGNGGGAGSVSSPLVIPSPRFG